MHAVDVNGIGNNRNIDVYKRENSLNRGLTKQQKECQAVD